MQRGVSRGGAEIAEFFWLFLSGQYLTLSIYLLPLIGVYRKTIKLFVEPQYRNCLQVNLFQ